MPRPYRTALLAVVFAAAFSGTASAESNAPSSFVGARTPAGLTTGSIQASPDQSVAATLPEEPYAVPERARARLLELEAAAMPRADADLEMWSGAGRAAVLVPAARAHRYRFAKGSDPIHRFARGIISRTSSIAMSLTRSAMRFIGTPYVFGGTSTSGFDCSGYTQHVFAMLGIRLPRTADAQYDVGHPPKGGVTTGDLVFFQTYEPGPSHVGIYVGSGKFIHSSGHGVMVSRLAERYWSSRYLGAKRVAAFHD